jgi:hypothetical protein
MRKVRNFSAFVLQSCGRHGHKLRTSLGMLLASIHSVVFGGLIVVVKAVLSSPLYAQLGMFLYTSYQQYFAIIQSVTTELVHIFHIPYRYHSKANKGVY